MIAVNSIDLYVTPPQSLLKMRTCEAPMLEGGSIFQSSVLEEVMQGSVGAYLLLDYGIDPRRL